MDLADVAVRIARPSRDQDAARRFWVDGLGLQMLWETDAGAGGGHALLVLGAPGAGWHLELVADRTSAPAPRSAERDPREVMALRLTLCAALTGTDRREPDAGSQRAQALRCPVKAV